MHELFSIQYYALFKTTTVKNRTPVELVISNFHGRQQYNYTELKISTQLFLAIFDCAGINFVGGLKFCCKKSQTKIQIFKTFSYYG